MSLFGLDRNQRTFHPKESTPSGSKVYHESKQQNQELGGLATGQVRQRSVKQLLDIPPDTSSAAYDPNDLFSSAMDNVPLKDLFPNVKVRKRQLQERKVVNPELPSPRSQENQESTRAKLRESLVAALRIAGSAEHSRNSDLEKLQTRDDDKLIIGEEVDRGVLGGGEQVKADDLLATYEVQHGHSESLFAEENLFPQHELNAEYETLRRKTEAVTADNSHAYETQTSFLYESPFKRIKLEVEEDYSGSSYFMEQTEKVAVSIEAELFRLFGGVNRKYKEKARSLLFNLKDRSNPELRTRVLSGEITPKNLCCMSAEQLASRELSQWRMAKAEEFAHMVVLADTDMDTRRLVKKTHKGEFEVQVEKDEVPTEALETSVRQRSILEVKREKEEKSEDIEAEAQVDSLIDDVDAKEVTDIPEFSPIRDSFFPSMNPGGQIGNMKYESNWMMVPQSTVVEPDLLEDSERDKTLPTILSLDEYLGSRKGDELPPAYQAERVGVEMLAETLGTKGSNLPLSNENHVSDSLMGFKGQGSSKHVGSPNIGAVDLGSRKPGETFHSEKNLEHNRQEKLWEGSFQLSGYQISPVLAFFRSGERVGLQSWPKMVEVKGRVRLDALDKFLQELHLSRTRSIMVISCRLKEGQEVNGSSVNAMKEAANQYQKGERVGYAEPAPGFELYLFPPVASSLKLLSEHGCVDVTKEVADEQEILVGCIVWRRNLASSNLTHKASSHYFTANRHALSGQLDSPTRPNEAQWTKQASASFKTTAAPLDNASTGLPLKSQLEAQQTMSSFTNAQNFVSVSNVKGEDVQVPAIKHMPIPPLQQTAHRSHGSNVDFSRSVLVQKDPQSVRSDASPHPLQNQSKDDDVCDDLPPGFGPRAGAMIKPGIETRAMHEEDDDLPEFDFASEKIFQPLPHFNTNISEVSNSNASFISPLSGVQGSLPLPQGSSLSQMPLIQHGPPTFSVPSQNVGLPEQMKSSSSTFFFPARPQIFARMPGSIEQVHPPIHPPVLLSNSVVLTQGPRPPSMPHPSQPLNTLPQRPVSVDGHLFGRPPGVVSVQPGLLQEQRDSLHSNLFTFPQVSSMIRGPFGDIPRPLQHAPPALHEQRGTANYTGLSMHSNSGPCILNLAPAKEVTHGSETRASNMWDDDDMPEWCPPPLIQRENLQPPVPPLPPPMFGAGAGLVKDSSQMSMSTRPFVQQAGFGQAGNATPVFRHGEGPPTTRGERNLTRL